MDTLQEGCMLRTILLIRIRTYLVSRGEKQLLCYLVRKTCTTENLFRSNLYCKKNCEIE
jgi:hypothetical protein